jgi:nucleoside-diphosphate-sugar epimerase
MKNIFVTGNLGYIGSIFVPLILQEGYNVTGYDIGYYDKECCLYQEESIAHRQIIKDIRDISEKDVEGMDAVVHLAALSNDPLGEIDPIYTEEINLKATLRLAEHSRKAGVKRFIYSSSQSMYGISDTDDELDENAPKTPLTAYARTKWAAECALKELSSTEFAVVCFRPSTVFGASPKLRCDIVFNNLVACAYATGKIEIKSDGSPWRPVIHVKDVCNAYIAGLQAPVDLVRGESFNVGIRNGNYTVKDLAEAAQSAVPGSALIYTGEHGGDSRTYKVSFKKILTELKDYFEPQWDLNSGATELVALFQRIHFDEALFRGRTTNRLKQIQHLISERTIDNNLRLLQ